MLEDEVLVVEPLAEDGDHARAVSVEEVATLDHEVLDDSVEGGTLVANGLAELPAKDQNQSRI